MNISNHAKQRMKERCGFNKKAQGRMAQKAFDEGIAHNQTTGRLNKWVTSLFFKNCNANNIRLYGGFVYIFADDTLITVMGIPSNIKKNMEDMIK